MATTYEEALMMGGARIEYIWHVHGFPWAIATHPGVAALISTVHESGLIFPGPGNPSLAREIFGLPTVAGSYPADVAVVASGLNPPGEQKIKLSSNQGSVECGGWSVTVGHREYGITLPHRPENPVRGLEGIHNVPDPRQDGSIHHATLGLSFRKTDTTLYLDITSDHGLAALVTANVALGKSTYLWIGHECVAATSINVASFIELTVVRGIWRSREQSHYLDDHDGCPILVADVPIGGAVGRPCTLYALLVDDACETALDLSRARTGRVSTGIYSQDGTTTISCDGWTDWLRTPIKNKSFDAPLTGYLLSRPSAATATKSDAAGHLVVWEYGPGPAITNAIHIWLCAAGTSVWFDTYEELVLAMNQELALVSLGASVINAGTTTYGIYNVVEGKLRHANGFGTGAWCAGILPWAFGWHGRHISGEFIECKIRIAEKNDWTMATSKSAIETGTVLDQISGIAGGVYSWDLSSLPIGPGLFHQWHMSAVRTPSYLYQWPWDIDAFAEADDGELPPHYMHTAVSMHQFPVGLHPTHADHRLTVNESYDAQFFSVGDIAQLGDRDTTLAVRSAGDNYVELDAPNSNYRLDYDPTVPAIFLNFTCGYAKPVHKGQVLCSPWWTGNDIWPLRMVGSVTMDGTAQPWLLVSEMLGNAHADIQASERFAADHVPDVTWYAPAAPGIAVDQMPTIDWTSLATCFAMITGDETYQFILPPDSEVLLSKVIEGFLLAHGVSPTWEFDRHWKMWRMKFRALGILNATMAALAGRDLSPSNTRSGRHKYEHSRANQYNRVEYEGNYGGSEFSLKITADSQSAYAWTGSKKATLAIRDYLTQQPDVETIASSYELQRQFKELFALTTLARLAFPAPTVTLPLAPSLGTVIGCGVVVNVTDPTIRDQITDELGVTDRAGLVTEFVHRLYGAEHRATIQIGGSGAYGYVPSLTIPTHAGAVTGANTVAITVSADPTANEHQDPSLPLTDLGYFDCLTLDGEPRGCACGDYLCILIERYSTTPTIWRDVVISNIDLAAGTATLTAAGLGAGWVNQDWVLIFEAWDHDIEECQRRWLYHANENQKLTDPLAVETLGRSWA